MAQKPPSKMNKSELYEMNKRLTRENVHLQRLVQDRSSQLEYALNAEDRIRAQDSAIAEKYNALVLEHNLLRAELDVCQRDVFALSGALAALEQPEPNSSILELEEENASLRAELERLRDKLYDVRERLDGV